MSSAESDPRRAVIPGRDDGEHRPADWYELFFDLVFVVVIAVSAEVLEHGPTPGAVAGCVLLCFPLWRAGVNLMVAYNLHGRRYAPIGMPVLVRALIPA